MANTPNTNLQIAENAILDINGKQTYLGNAYIASTNLVDVVTTDAEVPLMYLSNPASNATATLGGPAQSVGLFQDVRKLLTAAGADGSLNFATFRFYLNPTILTLGTSITLGNLRAASHNTSLMTAHKSPTTSSNGTFITVIVSNLVEVDSSVLFILDPGQSMLVTVEVSTEASVACELTWYER